MLDRFSALSHTGNGGAPGKRALLFIFFSLAGVTLAQAVLAFTIVPTLGTLGRSLLIPLACLLACVLVLAVETSQIRLPSLRSAGLGWHIPFLVFASGLVAYVTLHISGSSGGTTTYVVALAAVATAVVMLLLSLSRDDAWGLGLMALLLPVWGYFLGWDTRLVTWPMLVATAYRLLRGRGWPGPTPLDPFMAALGVILLLASVAAWAPAISLTAFFNQIVMSWLWFMVVVARMHGMRDIQILFAGQALGAVLSLGMRYYFWAQAGGWSIVQGMNLYDVGDRWATGGAGSIAPLAAYNIPIAIGCALLTRTTRFRLLWAAPIVFMLFMLVISRVRSDLIALVATSVLLFLYSASMRRAYAAVAVMGMVAIAVIPSAFRDALLMRFQHWQSMDALAVDQAMRLDAWQAAWRIFLDHPWLGIGLEMWMERAQPYLMYFSVANLPQAHSLPLNYLSAGGVGALISLVALLGALAHRGLSLLGRLGSPPMRAIVICSLWSVAVEVVNGSVGGGWQLSASSWMMMGVICSVERMKRAEWTMAGANRQDSRENGAKS